MKISEAENQRLLDEIDALASISPDYRTIVEWWAKGLISTDEYYDMNHEHSEKVMKIIRGEGVTK